MAILPPMTTVGRSVPRREGADKVTGRARYTDDLVVPGAWYGKTIRSTVARGTLRLTTLDPAFDWSRVVVVTSDDIPGENVVQLIRDDQPALARLGSEIRHQAELLTAHLSRVHRGMKSVRLPEFDGSGDAEIALDPKLDPQNNAERLFRKARRLARGREESETQRAIQESEIAEADRALAALDPEPPIERLRELAKEIAPSVLAAQDRGVPAPPASEEDALRRPSLPAGFNPRVYDLPGGWEVWVGRNSKQNDELTHRHASQRDLWFHARGCQGSHVVLRISSGKGEPPKDVILAAAAIAAHHSKSRNSGLVPVAYTEKRYVRKPRKAPPGTAAMMREKVVMVRPSVPETASRS